MCKLGALPHRSASFAIPIPSLAAWIHLLVGDEPDVLLRCGILHKLAQLGNALRSGLSACRAGRERQGRRSWQCGSTNSLLPVCRSPMHPPPGPWTRWGGQPHRQRPTAAPPTAASARKRCASLQCEVHAASDHSDQHDSAHNHPVAATNRGGVLSAAAHSQERQLNTHRFRRPAGCRRPCGKGRHAAARWAT